MSEAIREAFEALDNLRRWADDHPAHIEADVERWTKAVKAALSGAQQGETGRFGYVTPDCWNNGAVGASVRLEPDARHTMPVFTAPQPAQVPEDLDVGLIAAILEDYAQLQTCGVIESANRYTASDANEQAEIIEMLTAAPSGDGKREAEIKAEAILEAVDYSKAKAAVNRGPGTLSQSLVLEYAFSLLGGKRGEFGTRDELAARLRQSGNAATDGVEKPENRVWLLADCSAFTNERVWFWKKNRAGYTSFIDKAHHFTEEQAKRQHAQRETDIPVPLDDVLTIAKQSVPMDKWHQYRASSAGDEGEEETHG